MLGSQQPSEERLDFNVCRLQSSLGATGASIPPQSTGLLVTGGELTHTSICTFTGTLQEVGAGLPLMNLHRLHWGGRKQPKAGSG